MVEERVTLAGAIEALSPEDGPPKMLDKATVPLKLLVLLNVTIEVAELPWRRVIYEGDADIIKSGPITVTVTPALLVRLPPTAIIWIE